MVLGIFVFVFEIALIAIGNMPLLDAGWAWFVIIGMCVATLLAIIGIFVNAFGIKGLCRCFFFAVYIYCDIL